MRFLTVCRKWWISWKTARLRVSDCKLWENALSLSEILPIYKSAMEGTYISRMGRDKCLFYL